MNLIIHDVASDRLGWVLIVTERGQDPEGQIADYTAAGRIDFLLSDPEYA